MRLFERSVSARVPSSVLGGYTPLPIPKWQREFRLALLFNFAVFYGILLALYSYRLLLELLAPLAIFGFVIIWMLPNTERAPKRMLAGLFWGFVGAQLLWPDYLAIDALGLPWITALRIFSFPMLLVLLISLSVSPTLRSELAAIIGAVSTIWKMLVVFLFFAVISIPFSRDVPGSIDKLVVALLYWGMIFFVSAYVFAQPGRMMRFLWLLWATVIVLCLLGLWEQRISRVPWAGHIPGFLTIEDEVVQRILTGSSRSATGIYRVQSKFTTPLGLSEFLAMVTPFVLHIAITARHTVSRVAAIANIPLIFYVIVATDSRLGIVGFFLSFLFYLLAWGFVKRAQHKQSLVGTAVLLAYPAVLLAFVASTMFVPRISSMVWGSGAQQASTDARKEQYNTGIPLVLRQPWGYGLDQAAERLGFTNPAGILTIDTYVLAIALDTGVIGLIAYFGMFIVAIYAGGMATQLARDQETLLLMPLVVALANFLVIKTILSQADNHPLVFVMLGATVALVYRVKRDAAQERQILNPSGLKSPNEG